MSDLKKAIKDFNDTFRAFRLPQAFPISVAHIRKLAGMQRAELKLKTLCLGLAIDPEKAIDASRSKMLYGMSYEDALDSVFNNISKTGKL